MIYLHHTPLSRILSKNITQVSKSDRDTICEYRHKILTAFCQAHNLPTPIYDKHAFGKPFITNAPLAFNQSHCVSDYVLVYSLTILDVGVDIENIHRKPNFMALAKRYFHDKEYQLWQKSGYDTHLWFKLWTIKEAVLKAQGLGIRLNLNELNAIFISDDGGYVHHHKIGKFYFKNLMVNDCVITVAYPFDCGDVSISLLG